MNHNQMKQIEPETKKRYKMYKVKKHWVVAPILFIGTLGVMGLAGPVVNAEEVTPEVAKAEPVTPPVQQAQPPVETTKTTETAPTQAETVVNVPVEKQPEILEEKTETVPKTAEVEEPVSKTDVVSANETTSNDTTETPKNEPIAKPVEKQVNTSTAKSVKPEVTSKATNTTSEKTVVQQNEELKKIIEEAKKAGVTVNEGDIQLVKDSATSKEDYQKQIESIKKAIEKAKQDKAKHDEELKKVKEKNKEIENYNKQVAEHNQKEKDRVAKEKKEAEANRKKDGYLDEIALQKLKFEKEKNSKMTVTSKNKKLSVKEAVNQAKKNTDSDYLLGKVKDLAKNNPVYNLKVGEKLTVDYTLNNSYYDNTKLGKVRYTYTLKKADVKSKDGLIFLLADPTDTMYYMDYYYGSVLWNMNVTFFDKDNKQVDVSDSYVSFASLNAMKNDKGMSREYVKNFNGKYVPINGSSVKVHGKSAYSEKANTFKNEGAKWDGTEWDVSGSPLEYYGAIAGKTGKTISFDFGSDKSGYIWFAFNSKVKAPTISNPEYKKPKDKIQNPKAPDTIVNYHLNKYVPTPPTKPKKTVSDRDEKKVLQNLLDNVNESFTYDISHQVPEADKEAFYDSYVMKDIINSALNYNGIHKVLNEAGQDVTNWFTVTTNGKQITFTLNKANNNANFYGHTYNYNFGVNIANKEKFVKEHAGKVSFFDNQATAEIDGVEHKSNVVKTKLVIPTPHIDPEKTVSDVDEKKVLENLLNDVSESFTYDVTHKIPQADKEAYYKTYVMKDTINEYLTFDGTHTILNEAGQDVTSWFDITTDGQTVFYTLKQANNKADFYGHNYTYHFGVNITDKEAFVKKFAGKVSKFDNQATAEIDGVEHKSNVVKTKLVIPTPHIDPEKTVSDVDEKKVLENLLNDVSESFTYDVTHKIPQADKEAYYKTYVMKDTINEYLTFDGTHTILNEAGQDVTSWFDITTDGQTVFYTLKQAHNNADFYGHNYTYHFGVNITDKEAFVKKFAGKVSKFDNQATAEIDGVEHKSNVVKTKLVIPTPHIDPEKTVSDVDEKKVHENLLKEVSENFEYDITHEVPNADKEAYYKTYAVKDTIDENLSFTGRYLVLNEAGEDVTSWFDITTDGQTIFFTLKDTDNADFYGHTYTYNFGVKITDKEAFLKKFAGQTRVFDNTATVVIDGVEHHTNAVMTKVNVPKPEEPVIPPVEPQQPTPMVHQPAKQEPVKVTYPAPKQTETLPQTGEVKSAKSMGVMGGLLSLFGLAGLTFKRRKEEQN